MLDSNRRPATTLSQPVTGAACHTLSEPPIAAATSLSLRVPSTQLPRQRNRGPFNTIASPVNTIARVVNVILSVVNAILSLASAIASLAPGVFAPFEKGGRLRAAEAGGFALREVPNASLTSRRAHHASPPPQTPPPHPLTLSSRTPAQQLEGCIGPVRTNRLGRYHIRLGDRLRYHPVSTQGSTTWPRPPSPKFARRS